MKSKRCKQCKEVFMPQRPLQYLCGIWCATKYLANQKIKKEKKELIEMKKSLLTISDLKKEAKIYFQKWIRIRDNSLGYNCISCNTKITIPTSDGSHYFDANKFSGLIFNEMNCHASCQQCNRFFAGNLLEYREGLIKRYGIEYLNKLESLKDYGREKKYTREELIDIKNKYAKLIRDSKK